MSWREQIRPASFRGVPFGVSGDDKESGRRTVVHEFPQREEAYVEDLGAAATRFTVQAFVLGPDYMAMRDALERALAEPGPGTLVHPWYGEITVSQTAPYKVKHAATDGGMAVFTLSFARDGQPSSPASVVNPQSRALEKAETAGFLSCDAFDAAFTVAGQSAYVVGEAYRAVTGAIARVRLMLGGDISQIAALLGASTGYDFLSFVSLGRTLWGAYQGLGAAAGKSAAALAGDWQKIAARDAPASVVENPGGTRARIAANENAVNAFTRQIAVVETSRALALAMPASRDAAKGLREGYMDALDSVLADEGGISSALYASFAETRAATLAALADAARSAPDVIVYTPAASLPSLVLCHRLTGDIALDADLVARNGIIHPGFVPVEPLEVLTYE